MADGIKMQVPSSFASQTVHGVGRTYQTPPGATIDVAQADIPAFVAMGFLAVDERVDALIDQMAQAQAERDALTASVATLQAAVTALQAAKAQ